jgi:hypothetical protein
MQSMSGKLIRQMVVMTVFLSLVPSLGGSGSHGVFAAEDVDLVITPVRSVSETALTKTGVGNRMKYSEVERGSFFTINTGVSNLGEARSGPFDVRLYLSHHPDGRDVAFEFDVLRDISLAGFESTNLTRTYLIPYSLAVAERYWLMVEADPDKSVTDKDEQNNRKTLSGIGIPCWTAHGYSETYKCQEKALHQ